MDVLVFSERKREKCRVQRVTAIGTVSLVVKKSVLRCFGCVKQKDNAHWVKQCMMIEVDGTRQRKMFGLSLEEA